MNFEVRIHGRGGQGVVTAAELLAQAAFKEGRHAQAFPSFGSERTGAPVVAFCRTSDRPIRSHEPVAAPDALVIQDPTLLHQVDVFSGLRPDGYVLINTERSFDDLGLGDLAASFQRDRLMTVAASEIARSNLGRPMPGPALLGGLAALTGMVPLTAVTDAVHDRFSGAVAEGNAAAAAEAHAVVGTAIEELAHA